MCGIAGIIDFNSESNDPKTVGSMLRAINHRGPDESGIYHSPVATIGSVRLSIIDLAGGQQPMLDQSNRFCIVFNGEIFNYRELRSDLEKKGVKFISHSDTEVLLQLFIKHGKNCVNFLNGQFSFAIWDKVKEELFIARDRVGIRPFFYSMQGGKFSFASEIKALFKQADIRRELLAEGLNQVYTFWTTLSPYTVFRDVYELPPAHYAVYGKNGFKQEKYWDLRFEESNSPVISLQDAMDHFHSIFSDAVRIRLRADVEVAAYLSGGIDSSATVSYIKDIEPGVLNSFSIGFNENDFDESQFQNTAANYFKTRHQAITCSAKDIADIFPSVVWHSEIPLTRTAPAPMYLLSKLVRENNIKVVITGEGSDELLGGYDIFKENAIRRFWSAQPDSQLRPLLLKKLYPYIPALRNSTPGSLKMFFGFRLEDTSNPFYSHLLRWNNSNHIKKHLSDVLRNLSTGYSPLNYLEENLPSDFYSWNSLSKAQWLETSIFMSGYLLSSQGDRMGMANSVEGRYPFLDYRLIEFCAKLPSGFKLNGLNEKFLLKKVLKGKIPESIVKRTKQPYRAPVKNVFFSSNRPEYVDYFLSESFTKKAGIFNYNTLNPVLDRIKQSGYSSEVDDMLLTSVISTHLIFHQYIENNNSIYEPAELNNLRILDESGYLQPSQLPKI